MISDTKPAEAQEIERASQFGIAGEDTAGSVSINSTAISEAGYTTGTFSGQTNTGGDDAFVAKYDTDGNQQWVREFGCNVVHGGVVHAYYAQAFSVSVDSTGEYLAGDLGTTPECHHAFVAHYDTDGNEVWLKQIVNAGHAYGVSNNSTDVYVAGETSGTSSGQSSSGGTDAFLVRLVPPIPPFMSLSLISSPVFGYVPLNVTYSYNVTNLRDFTLSAVSVSDDLCSPVSPASVTTLPPGAFASFTCTHTFTTVGEFTNTANATATTPDGSTVSATSTGRVRVSFFVIPESPIGSIAVLASSLAALSGFAFFRYMRKGSNQP